MICQRCLYRSTFRRLYQAPLLPSPSSKTSSFLTTPPPIRLLTTTPHPSSTTISTPSAIQSKPRQTTPTSPTGPPSATSTSAAQPFSTPLTPSPAALGVKPIKSPTKASANSPAKSAKHVVSSVPGGTSLKGLGYMKGKEDPIALSDEEYPDWLWGCLSETKKAGGEGGVGGEGGGDLFSKSKKQRRAAAKQLRKQALLNPESLAPKIPLQEQSIDLPFNGEGSLGGALEALGSREELTRAMRGKRRSGIKESNFLRGMK